MKQIVLMFVLSVSVAVSAQDGRIMLSAYESITRMQDVMMEERMPEDRSHLPVQELFAQRPAGSDGRIMLSAYDSITRMQEQQMSMPETRPPTFAVPAQDSILPQPQWYDTLNRQQPVSYQMPSPQYQYAGVYAPNQAFTNWLFGTPKPRVEREVVYVEVTPTPAPVVTETPSQRFIARAEVSARAEMQPTPTPTPVVTLETMPTIVELSTMDWVAYYTQKIGTTLLLLVVIGYALFKMSPRRKVEDDMQRMRDDKLLDEFIYGGKKS